MRRADDAFMGRRQTLENDWAFDQFWSSYPKRFARDAAKQAWDEIGGALVLEDILTALSWQKQLPEWQKQRGLYVPHPANYLRGRRWTDEPPEGAQMSEKSARVMAMVKKPVRYEP